MSNEILIIHPYAHQTALDIVCVCVCRGHDQGMLELGEKKERGRECLYKCVSLSPYLPVCVCMCMCVCFLLFWPQLYPDGPKAQSAMLTETRMRKRHSPRASELEECCSLTPPLHHLPHQPDLWMHIITQTHISSIEDAANSIRSITLYGYSLDRLDMT